MGSLRTVAGLLVLASLLATSGCRTIVGAVTYPFREWVFMGAFGRDNPWDERWREPEDEHDLGEVVLGISFSGGGSRSAYFATCVLDELGKRKIPGTDRTYLEELDYVGGVSGGSLAATYYIANRHREGFPTEHDAFFARMRRDLGKDFENRALARLLLAYWPLHLFTHYHDGDLLEAVWNANFFDDLTYGDLDPKGPALLVSAACYNNGYKFVFSRKPFRRQPEAARYLQDLQFVKGWGKGYDFAAALTFETLDSDIAQCPLTTGVAASAAVPGLIQPVALKDNRNDTMLYLGDGGIYDNLGAETLFQAMLPDARDHPDKPAIMLVVDAAGVFQSGEAAGRVRSILAMADRTTAIAWLRTSSLAEIAIRLLVRDLVRDGVLRGSLQYRIITLYDEQALNPTARTRELAREILGTLVEVPTRFHIASENAMVIDRATPVVVGAALGRVTPVPPKGKQREARKDKGR